MSSDLLKQIDDLVASRTFNLEALEGIKAIKDELSKKLSEIEFLKNQNKDLRDEVQTLKSGNETNGNRIEELNQQIAANAKIVEDGKKAVWEKQIAAASAAAYQDALQTVFKPSTVRETVWQSIPISQNYNGNTTVMPYQQETKTTKEEL